MPLESTFRELCDELRRLHDMLVALRLTVTEDPPVQGEAVLAEQLENSILDLMASLQEGLQHAGAALKATAHPIDLARARGSLAACQERFHKIETLYSNELACFERLKDLAALGQHRRGGWIPWARIVKEGIGLCRPPIEATRKALGNCWQEVAERTGTTSISVRTSNIGQKITNPGLPAGDSESARPGHS